jgi:hypothetical protein
MAYFFIIVALKVREFFSGYTLKGWQASMSAIALCGSILIENDGTTITYKKKCDNCSHIEPGTTTTSISRGSIFNSSEFCSKCKNTYNLKIQGT